MNSKTKPTLDEATIKRLFAEAGILNVQSIAPLGSGEFSAVYSVDANDRGYVLKVSPRGDEHCMAYEQHMLASEIYCRLSENYRRIWYKSAICGIINI